MILNLTINNLSLFGQAFYRINNTFISLSTAIRLDLFFKGISLFSVSPVLGHGIGSSSSLLFSKSYFHNNYIQLLVEVGVLGFIFYYSWLLYIIRQLWILKADKLASLLFSIMFVLLLSDITNTTYYHKVNYIWYSICMLYVIQNNRKYFRFAKTSFNNT